MLAIDGSQGEGGGQILRSALALSLVTGTPFRIDNIRAGRKSPGLLRQHLTAVKAAQEIGSAEVLGAAITSSQLTFKPQRVSPGVHRFAVGSAGSATLVLQTVLPALMTASGSSSLTLEGGTHNPWAPPFDFLEKAFLPLLARMGPKVSVLLERRGFFPAGGGKFKVIVEPAPLKRLDLPERGELRAKRATAVVASLAVDIARRELHTIERKLKVDRKALKAEEDGAAHGPGNVVMIEIESEHVTEVFTSFGEKGVKAEAVADRAVDEACDYLDGGAPVGPHLADQLMLPIALAGGGSYVTGPLTGHSTTNIDVIAQFLGRRLVTEVQSRTKTRVSL